jgi:hypothetical protein
MRLVTFCLRLRYNVKARGLLVRVLHALFDGDVVCGANDVVNGIFCFREHKLPTNVAKKPGSESDKFYKPCGV